MTNIVMWSSIVGFFLPPVIALVQQPGWSNRVRSVVAFAACAVAGAGTAYFQGDLTGRRFVEAGLVVLVTAMATFRNFWKTTGVSPMIEDATALKSEG
jgi:VIT1/CCC1 family predicted Fe2+/Mn2+ transporter